MKKGVILAGSKGVILILLLVLSSGCEPMDAEVVFDFDRGEQWELSGELTFPSAMRDLNALLGIQDIMDDIVSEAEADGVEASWQETREDDSAVYTINMAGEGYQTLNQLWFGEDDGFQVEEVRGKRVVSLDYAWDESDFAFVRLTIRAGEILSGNGRRVDNRTMVWENHIGDVEVRFMEPRGFNWLFALGLVVGVGAVGVIALAWLRGHGRQVERGRQMEGEKHVAYCTGCGAQLSDGAKFCVSCGRKRQ